MTQLPEAFPPALLESLPVGEKGVPASSGAPVVFPYDGSVVATAPVGDTGTARQALEEAVGIKAELADVASYQRKAVLLDAHRAVSAHREAFEQLLVLETGKPLVDCRVEVARSLVTLETAAEEVARVHGETVPLDLLPAGDGLVGFWVRRPVGVVVGIAGFNYPLLLASHKIAPGLAAGCPVICKPAPATPLATLWLVDIIRQALVEHGMPASSLQLVTGDASVGSTLTTDRRVGAVSFTGSAAIGHEIARAAAPTKTLLELGSNSALVVAPDADLDAAADAVLRGGFYASGQACISVQRVLGVGDAYDGVLERVLARLPEVIVGDPRDPATRVSSLINPAATARVDEWIAAAVAAGARLAGGGGSGVPTVLADVPDGAAAWDEEIFGPVVCFRRVPDVETALATVNRSRYGLHASVFTRSLATSMAALRTLEVGGVVVNDVPGFRADNMPYGGVKDSGVGREGPRFAIEDLTVTRMAIIRP